MSHGEEYRHTGQQWYSPVFITIPPFFFSQRYFVNELFYKPGGPVFLMIGGEGPANPAWMQDGTWLTYAEKLGALCFMLEHRFYGKSRPTAYVCPCCLSNRCLVGRCVQTQHLESDLFMLRTAKKHAFTFTILLRVESVWAKSTLFHYRKDYRRYSWSLFAGFLYGVIPRQ